MPQRTSLELRAMWLADYYTKEELARFIAYAERDLNSTVLTLTENTEETENLKDESRN